MSTLCASEVSTPQTVNEVLNRSLIAWQYGHITWPKPTAPEELLLLRNPVSSQKMQVMIPREKWLPRAVTERSIRFQISKNALWPGNRAGFASAITYLLPVQYPGSLRPFATRSRARA